MKVILQKDVPNLGDAGEVKDVAAGYARNYLIPRNFVIVAQAGSTRALEHQQQLMARQAAKRTKAMQGLAGELSTLGSLDVTVRVGANGKMFGSVTPMVVAQALAARGHAIDRRKVDLGERIRNPGTYNIKLRLAEKIHVPLTLNVIAEHDPEEEWAPVVEERSRPGAESQSSEADAEKEADSE